MPASHARLRLTKNEFEELAIIASEADRLASIVTAASKIGPSVGVRAVAEAIAGAVGLDESELLGVLIGLLNLYHTQTGLKLDPKATVELIGQNLRRSEKSIDDKELVQKWESAKQKVSEALSQLSPDHPLEAAHKALRVVASRQYDFVKMKVYTDVRPIFNEQGTSVVQSIIAHVLSIDYHDGHDHHVIQFTLDAEDIAELKKECDRAELKGTVLKKDLRQLSWPTSVFRESAKPDDHNGKESI